MVPAKGTVRIMTGRGTNTAGVRSTTLRYWGKTSYVWNNTGDTITLKSPKGAVLDTCTYKDRSTKDDIKSAAC